MRRILLIFLIAFLLFLALNVEVSTRQGINYKVQTLKIPLYLKLSGFFDRHFNYGVLAKRITKDADSETEKAMRIFAWVYGNIKRALQSLPVIDDHVWHIIIRGYGVSDQFEDVFTTLCNYTGLNAFFTYVYTKDKKFKRPFSFVKFKRGWSIFDSYNGVYFKNSKNEIANVEDITNNDWRIVNILNTPMVNNYSDYFESLACVQYENSGLARAAIQSPVKRFIYWIENEKGRK